MSITVMGKCPQGCGERLRLLEGSGSISCTNQGCPEPFSVTRILNEATPDHIVEVHEDRTFSIKHPLKERVEDKLFQCDVHEVLKFRSVIPECGMFRTSNGIELIPIGN